MAQLILEIEGGPNDVFAEAIATDIRRQEKERKRGPLSLPDHELSGPWAQSLGAGQDIYTLTERLAIRGATRARGSTLPDTA